MTAINEDRGEVGLTLKGRVYPMLPTIAAVNAIEVELGSVYWLSQRIILGVYFPTFRELGVIAAECMRAAGRDRGDEMLAKYSTDKIAQMIFEEGLTDEVTHAITVKLFANMIGGGSKKKAASESPPPSEPTA